MLWWKTQGFSCHTDSKWRAGIDSPVLVLAEGGGGRWGEEYDVSNERGADGDGGSMHGYEEADGEGADCKEKSRRAKKKQSNLK